MDMESPEKQNKTKQNTLTVSDHWLIFLVCFAVLLDFFPSIYMIVSIVDQTTLKEINKNLS